MCASTSRQTDRQIAVGPYAAASGEEKTAAGYKRPGMGEER